MAPPFAPLRHYTKQSYAVSVRPISGYTVRHENRGRETIDCAVNADCRD